MTVLPSALRRDLESACVLGRRGSEVAVRVVLGGLDVWGDRPPAHLGEEDRVLRRGLRAKSRQLGDSNGSIELLVAECAFEQWHRLLFARFLAENDLLIHPQAKVPVSLAECEELAGELGEPDGWAAAGRFAAEILPGIFRLDDPCVRLRLAPEGRIALEKIVAGLPAEVFVADDALGWVYQFWQKDKKDEVNASERKIGGADLGPVTQLFTENYMVRFLLENSLGAWWAARHPDSPLVKQWEYLRFDDNGRPAAGTFEGWPDTVAEVTVMDPCCGSGHFLVEAFGMLWAMRAEEENLTPVAAQDAVLRDNLFGLELDPRCVQIAMFAVALQAWKAGGNKWRQLPTPNIACSGIPVKAPLAEWTALANGDPALEGALTRLHTLFKDADTLGSLINPRTAIETSGSQTTIDDVDWYDVAPLLEQATSRETDDPAHAVLGADATGLARVAATLNKQFTLTATNPPFLGRPKESVLLMDFTERRFKEARHDLATVMFDRWHRQSDATAFVTPQGWLFQPRWTSFREALLRTSRLIAVAWLGEHAFESAAAAGAFASLQICRSGAPQGGWTLFGIDCDSLPTPGSKAAGLRSQAVVELRQDQQRANPDSRILIESSEVPLLGEVADSYQGIKTCDNPRFAFAFWELPGLLAGWVPVQSAPAQTQAFDGRSEVVFWEDGRGAITEVCQAGSTFRGEAAWARRGVIAAEMRSLHSSIYTGEIFDGTATVVVPKNPSDADALWCFVSSSDFAQAIRSVDRKLSVATSTLVKVPFDVERWRKVAEEDFPDGLPEPWSDDPTQWLFEGRPEVATEPLQVAVGRLLGYRWPEQTDDDLDELADADGIVCLPSVLGERGAADRVQELLARAYGSTWGPTRTAELLVEAGSKKKDLDTWLRDELFATHCKVFKNRPFIWHIWDGRKTDGFSALVNYHQLDYQKLQVLTYSYLGDWIERQQAGIRDDTPGAQERLAAAQDLQRRLELILDGEPPYDLYIRWKELREQPIGWNPDLNDGVRLNVRPFVEAGVLRAKFNVKWDKDRGKNPDGTERHNNLHHTRAIKQAARNGQ